jgi:lipopolysaccharide transport system permease protein
MNITLWRQITLAWNDLFEGSRNWRIWYVLGLSDVRQRYRRSLFGPFWIALSIGIQTLVMGLLLAYLFKIEGHRYFPFLCAGIIIWSFISNSITEGANCFILMGSVILQVKRPVWTYMMQTLWRNVINLAHTMIVFVVTAFVFRVVPTEKYLLVPAGLAVLAANVSWMAFAAGLLSARFRDTPILIQTVLPLVVWLTPVYYQPDQLGPTTRLIIELNPLTHVVEVARAPFLNTVPALSTWLAAAGTALFGWLLTFALFVRSRARVPFWL